MTRPGVTRRMSWTESTGRSEKSRSRTDSDDAALIGLRPRTIVDSPVCATTVGGVAGVEVGAGVAEGAMGVAPDAAAGVAGDHELAGSWNGSAR